MTIFLIFALLGLFSGFVAGLFGVGGGLLMVPILSLVFPWVGIPEHLAMHMAVATSLGVIVMTSLSSAWAHHKKQNVDWGLAKSLMPGLVIGAFLSAIIADHMPGQVLMFCFMVFAMIMGTKFFLSKAAQANHQSRLQLKPWQSFGSGVGIGGVSTLIGIGGGTLMVPLYYKVTQIMRVSVGTSSAGTPLFALFAMLAYIFTGSDLENTPQWSLGYVYLPALIGVGGFSTLMAGVGAKCASQMNEQRLKKCFGAFLWVVAVQYLIKLFG